MPSAIDRAQLPLNALRAFEASARHLNFTKTAQELCVSQGAVSQQVAQLGALLFRRLPRGLMLTDEGRLLLPVMGDALDRIGATLDRIEGGRPWEILNIGVVGTFAGGWLLDRLADFDRACPHVDLRITTNNNRVDLAGEGLDLAIRFGDGAWHGTHADPILRAPLAPLCTPDIAARPRSGRSGARDFAALLSRRRMAALVRRGGRHLPRFARTGLRQFDPDGAGGPARAGRRPRPAGPVSGRPASRTAVQPFAIAVDLGGYWLTRLMSRPDSPAMADFRHWLIANAEG